MWVPKLKRKEEMAMGSFVLLLEKKVARAADGGREIQVKLVFAINQRRAKEPSVIEKRISFAFSVCDFMVLCPHTTFSYLSFFYHKILWWNYHFLLALYVLLLLHLVGSSLSHKWFLFHLHDVFLFVRCYHHLIALCFHWLVWPFYDLHTTFTMERLDVLETIKKGDDWIFLNVMLSSSESFWVSFPCTWCEQFLIWKWKSYSSSSSSFSLLTSSNSSLSYLIWHWAIGRPKSDEKMNLNHFISFPSSAYGDEDFWWALKWFSDKSSGRADV